MHVHSKIFFLDSAIERAAAGQSTGPKPRSEAHLHHADDGLDLVPGLDPRRAPEREEERLRLDVHPAHPLHAHQLSPVLEHLFRLVRLAESYHHLNRCTGTAVVASDRYSYAEISTSIAVVASDKHNYTCAVCVRTYT